MSRLFGKTGTALLLTGAVAILAPVAEAGYTAVKEVKRRSEASHEKILETVYGGDFIADPTGLSFSNQTGVTVTRLNDAAGDEPWAGKTVSARAVAAFSGNRKTARYFGASSGGQVQKVFDAPGRRFDVSGAAPAPISVDDGSLVLGRGRGQRTKQFSSINAENADGMDHLVSYEVKGTAQRASVYLLCWEDKLARRSDRDYNDLVVELEAADVAAQAPLSQPLLIPLPPPAWTGLGGLLGLGVASALRRRQIRA